MSQFDVCADDALTYLKEHKGASVMEVAWHRFTENLRPALSSGEVGAVLLVMETLGMVTFHDKKYYSKIGE